ncbi:MAG: M1 family metallopeptidase [Acidobacteria bacterium]|nr:M1 family metallopeptidase [Acidobacteriota bacterium]MYJ04826.1 M1 family metallopeptidase [Acidobacteriota bacterium]
MRARHAAVAAFLLGLAVTPGGAQAPTSPRNANYDIDVTLDPAARTLTGRETLTWRNISPNPTSELQFHLYYNAWRNTRSTWMRERLLGRGAGLHNRAEEDWGWIDVTSMRLRGGAAGGDDLDLLGQAAFIAPDDGNPDDRTVLRVPLPAPVAPGETIDVEIEWTTRIPRPFARTGAVGDYFFLAHWFPKIGVLEADGWNCHQFHTGTEFFSDYGVYDVRITAPSGWVVGATGRAQGVTDNGDGKTIHTFHAEDVHEFAWTTSPDFVVVEDRFEHPTLPPVDMRLLLQPEHAGQEERHFRPTRETLRLYGEWFGAYPWDHLTIVDPAWRSSSGGMEYPMFITAGTRWLAPASTDGPEEVTVHEAGHMFFQSGVGNNEMEHSWIDEGLDTYATARVMEQEFPFVRELRFFGGFVPWPQPDVPWDRVIHGDRIAGYRAAARSDVQATPTFRYWPGTGGAITYNKSALYLHTLERHLGWDVVRRGMADFYRQWKFGHPKPNDFFDAMNGAAGEDLGWFFDQVHGSSAVFDYGIAALSSRNAAGRGWFDDGRYRDESGSGAGANREARSGPDNWYESLVTVRRYGDGIFPVEVVVEFADGTSERRRWDGQAQWTYYRFVRPSRAVTATVDPDRVLLLDIDFTNNSRTTRSRAGEAAAKWTLAWIVWVQDLLLTAGFLA